MTAREIRARCLQEVAWWVGRFAQTVRQSPGRALVVAAMVWLAGGTVVVPLGLAAGLLAVRRIWMLADPVSYARVSGSLRGRLCLWRIRRRWSEICQRCALADPRLTDRHWGGRWVPRIIGSSVDWPHLSLRVRPLLGQTGGAFEAAAEAVRMGVGASRLRVEQAGVNDVVLTFTIGDGLRVPFLAQPGASGAPLDLVAMGRREDGKPWRLAVGPHTLVAGCSGSGKGSVFWSFAFALSPAIRDGRVRLHGIDLKGGMEIRMGEALFTTVATNAAEAVAVLEQLVGWMQDRTRAYAGHVRSHLPTIDEPLHVVMIDELAALTAYCGQRDLQRRAETAINLLCSQGRAPGFMVLACLQDPRKEVIPSRGLFTQMVGLRLKDVSETSMVLGEIAVDTGAHCHRITRDVPGTGYVLPEDGTHPVRVRAGYASDDAIRTVARQFATPERIEVVVPDETEPTPRTRSRKPRSTEAA